MLGQYLGPIPFIFPEYRGNGYVGEAVKLLFKVFRANKLNKIYISNSPENISSRRVCEKLNLKFLGTYELPLDNSMRLEDGKTHINVFEANI